MNQLFCQISHLTFVDKVPLIASFDYTYTVTEIFMKNTFMKRNRTFKVKVCVYLVYLNKNL